MQVNYHANIKNKSNDLRDKIKELSLKYNPRPEMVEEREEDGITIKVYEPR